MSSVELMLRVETAAMFFLRWIVGVFATSASLLCLPVKGAPGDVDTTFGDGGKFKIVSAVAFQKD
jgi:hypothetical protein